MSTDTQNYSPKPDSHHYYHRDTSTLVYAIVTGLAAAFNVLVILVISLVLMPKVDQAVAEGKHNRAAIEKNLEIANQTYDLLNANWKELEHHRKVIKRLSDALDAAEQKAKMIEKSKTKNK